MIDQSLLNSNFIGRDGFRWWIGQIAPIEAQKSQQEGKGWGNRFKTRILGYHPFSKEDLPDDDLPWASVLLPPTSGSGGANFFHSVRIRPGDVVMGFFLDGDNAQIPVIFGLYGRTKSVSQDAASIGFAPFTGYTERVKPNDATITSEAGETEKNSQKNNSILSEDKIKKLNEEVEKNNENKDDDEKDLKFKAISSTVGASVDVANDCDDNFLTEVSSTLDDLVAAVDSGTDFLGDIAQATSKIQKMSNNLVSNTMSNLYEKLVPEMQGGLESLYEKIAPVKGPAAAIAAQEALIPKVKGLDTLLECAPGKIVDGLDKTIQDLLNDALLSVSNTGICIAEQFTASLLDGIINDISDTLDDALDGLSSILSVGFKVSDVLRSSSDLFKSAGAFIGCNQKNSRCVGKIKTIKTGGKPKKPFDINVSFDNVLSNLNSNPGGSGGTSFTKPDCANVDFCGPPVVNIFGGDGIGGAAKAIMGGIVRNTDGLSDVTADLSRTGSIIGVEITDPGAGYFTTPPLITFEDPCNNGYGSVARAIVDFNSSSPTYGQITAIDVISVGENYPVSPADDSDAINADQVPVGVIDTIVVNTGQGYVDAVVTDDNVIESETTFSRNDIKYDVVIQNGRIISVKPINNIQIQDVPTITVTSKTGSGALIKPVIGRLPLTPQGEVVQVIDCISPNINNIVGYVDGKPYTGTYHIMPNGVKMTGSVHSDQDRIIYDTPQESFRSARYTVNVGTAITMTETEMFNIETEEIETYQVPDTGGIMSPIESGGYTPPPPSTEDPGSDTPPPPGTPPY